MNYAQPFPGVPCITYGLQNMMHTDAMFDNNNVLIPRPASFWLEFSNAEKMLFGQTHNIYLFPTIELITELEQIIDGRSAIEICAGNGGISGALGIPGTDSKNLNDTNENCSSFTFGSHVEKCEASLAVAKYKPKVVIGAWVDHLYDPKRHDLGGHTVGVDEHHIISEVDEYILIGNTSVHRKSPLLEDLHSCQIKTHRIMTYFVGTEMLQSRSRCGLNFMLRLTRK